MCFQESSISRRREVGNGGEIACLFRMSLPFPAFVMARGNDRASSRDLSKIIGVTQRPSMQSRKDGFVPPYSLLRLRRRFLVLSKR